MIVNERLNLSNINNQLNDERFSDLKSEVLKFCEKITDKTLRDTFYRCFFNTIHTTVLYNEKDEPVVITGDIPAMWLRDSSVQIMQYLLN